MKPTSITRSRAVSRPAPPSTFTSPTRPPPAASYTAIPQMLSDNTVDIFSLSFGYCELYLGTATNQADRRLVAAGGHRRASPSWSPPAITARPAATTRTRCTIASAGPECQRLFHHAIQRCRGRHRFLWPAQRRILHLRQQQLQLDQLLPFCPGLYSGIHLERLHTRPTARSAATLRKSTARAAPISSAAPAARATAPPTPPPSATPA